MTKLEGKIAIVTGSSKGIGKAIALRFAREGAKVMVCSRILSDCEKVVDEIGENGGQGIAIKVDVANSEEIYTAVRDVLARWGKIDILVNNAGIGPTEWFIKGDEREWDKIIAINLKGTIVFTHAVLPGMVERRYGKIINISSTAGKIGNPRQAVYSASKGGIIAFTKSLAREFARYQININDICPGLTDTPGIDHHARKPDPEYFAKLEQGVPWKRIGQPEEVAAAALFLASD